MNNPDHDATFDRLVDGELPPAEYRALLAALDDEPGGWRRCALAFLESQAWGQELSAVREESVRSEERTTAASTPQSTATSYVPALLALAACFVVAFGLGFLLRGSAVPNDSGPLIVEETPREKLLTADRNYRDELRASPDFGEPIHRGIENVTLVVGESEADAQRIELPVVQYTDVGDDYFTAQRTTLPPHMRALLEHGGHRLQRSERLVPLTMSDGRQIVVPVEEVEIVPVEPPVL